MRTEREIDELRTEIRRLKRWLGAAGILGLAILATAAADRNGSFQEIEAERIRIVGPDGKLALAIGHAGGLPGPMMNGRQFPQEVSGGRTRAAGMIFFNDQGDEVGGLTYHGEPTGDGYTAVGHLSFDQWKQDQVVALQYQDDGTRRSAGLNIWDRSTTLDIMRLLELAEDRVEATSDAARDSIRREMQALAAEGEPGAHRVFLGSADRAATLLLRDTEGRPRLRIAVDSADVARIDFLDESGAVIHTLPPDGGP